MMFMVISDHGFSVDQGKGDGDVVDGVIMVVMYVGDDCDIMMVTMLW